LNLSRLIGKTTEGKVKRFSIFCSLVLCGSAFGYTANGNTYQTDGSQADVQAACSAAAAGSTIVLPAGSFSWTSPLTVSKNVTITGSGSWAGGSGTPLTGGTQITNKLPANGGAMVTLNTSPSSSGPSYMIFQNIALLDGGTDTNGYLLVAGGSGTPILTGCYVATAGGVDTGIRWTLNGGLIWKNTFYSTELPSNTPLAFYKITPNPSPDWQSPSTMGTADTTGTANTYVEGNVWNNVALSAFDLGPNSRVVLRYNTFNNSGGSSHGQDTGPNGVRHYEIYNNTFIFTTTGKDPGGSTYPLILNWWMLLRGGTGVVFNNDFPAISSEMWGNKSSVTLGDFNVNQIPNAVPCQTVYPSAEQIGQTYVGSSGYAWQTPGTKAVDGTGYGTDPLFVWGNTNTGATNVGLDATTDASFPNDNCGHGEATSTFIQANRDYIVGQAKPGYTPYPYPHPLESVSNGGGSGSPTATPTPTPTHRHRRSH